MDGSRHERRERGRASSPNNVDLLNRRQASPWLATLAGRDVKWTSLTRGGPGLARDGPRWVSEKSKGVMVLGEGTVDETVLGRAIDGPGRVPPER